MTRHHALALLLALAAAACSDRPQRLTVHDAATGSRPHGGLPPDHPPITILGGGEADSVVVLAGFVELTGELAGLGYGSFFLLGYDAASDTLLLVRKHEHSELVAGEGGELRLAFELSWPADEDLPEELELEVQYDLDGIVETRGDLVARTRVGARPGDLELRLRLDERARTDVPLPDVPPAGAAPESAGRY